MLRVIFVTVLITTVNTGVYAQALYSRQPTDPGESARARVEQSAARQRQSMAAMEESVALQRRSVERQPRIEWPARSFAFPANFSQPAITMPPPSCSALPSSEIDALVDNASKQTSVSADLIRSVMRQESAFRACAVSAKGAMGLMQLEPETAGDLGVTDAFDPEANVMGGARLLKQLLQRYGGDLSLTLGAYNAGPARVDAAMGVPMIPETMNYVSRILSRLSEKNRNSETVDDPAIVDQPRNNADATSLRLVGSESGR